LLGNLGSIRMASTNQSPQYKKAESNFLAAGKDEDRIRWLEEMIRECPKHKSSEKMLANLKTRYRKLKEKSERIKKSGKGSSGKKSIRKGEMQAVLIGSTNSGKSTLLSELTNTNPGIATYPFTTKSPEVGVLRFGGMNIQIVENPAFESEYYDRGLTNTADTLLLVVKNLEQITALMNGLKGFPQEKIIIFNDTGLSDSERKKLSATLQSKKYNFLITSLGNNTDLKDLKEKIFRSFGRMRIYTKEPGKEKSEKPIILEPGAIIKDIARKVLKNLSALKESRVWGPSSKFPGQVVGLNHELKDLDIVEFKTG